MTADLFADFAAELEGAPAPPKPAPVPVVSSAPLDWSPPARAPDAVKAAPAPRRVEPRAFPGKPVASFACLCGAIDEVLEPAPERVDCWSCKAPLSMYRWRPPVPPPSGNARRLTDAERARLP